MKRLIVVHGWGGSSAGALVSWVGKIGAEMGFETTVLDMPNTHVPTIDAWTKHLDDNVGYVDEITYFVGHSLGCQAVLRYLDMNKGSQVGGVILVAPPLEMNGLETEEDKDIIRPWIDRPIDFAAIRRMTPNPDAFVAIFSDNDTQVPLEANKARIEAGLHPKIIVEHAQGHFTTEDGFTELPSLATELTRFK
ncbi:MAG: hypothetical protein RIT04_151 [Candidatus Parcubacteria bacterium]|jgi:predicted alpha/beta hydrolase family esterase